MARSRCDICGKLDLPVLRLVRQDRKMSSDDFILLFFSLTLRLSLISSSPRDASSSDRKARRAKASWRASELGCPTVRRSESGSSVSLLESELPGLPLLQIT